MKHSQVASRKAKIVMATYRETVGNKMGLDIDIQDLLTDLMHLCDEKDIDFYGLLDRAKMHYHEEVQNELAGEKE